MSARIYTTRRLNLASGASIKNTNGNYIRVKIHKENRTVLKVKEENWTDEAHARYAELFPNDIDVKKPRKNKVKTASPAPEVPLLLPIEEEEKEDHVFLRPPYECLAKGAAVLLRRAKPAT